MELNFPIFIDHNVVVDPDNPKRHAIMVSAIVRLCVCVSAFVIVYVLLFVCLCDCAIVCLCVCVFA